MFCLFQYEYRMLSLYKPHNYDMFPRICLPVLVCQYIYEVGSKDIGIRTLEDYRGRSHQPLK